MTVQGRMEAATFKQTMGYLKPLLKMLRKERLSEDIRDSLSNMVRNVMQRNYIKANERYMEMAIGNAPWPIGVTNAGIHARPGRERIFSKHVAHVLNDESQRKYIQVKRVDFYFIFRSIWTFVSQSSLQSMCYVPQNPYNICCYMELF